MPEVHALLSASSAARWLHCPPSVRLTEHYPDRETTAAAEGTLAHALAEYTLKNFVDTGKITTYVPSNISSNPLYYAGMRDDIDPYIEYVVDTLNSRGDGAVLMVETRIDFSRFAPEGFGTGDAIILDDDRIEVIDLKFGTGVRVDAYQNPQLMLYGAGAVDMFGHFYDFNDVKVTIVQPRLDHVDSYVVYADDLLEWGAHTVAPVAEQAFNGEGEMAAGDWCQWCPMKKTCRHRAEHYQAIIDNQNNAVLSEEEMSQILTEAKGIKAWLKDIESYVTDELMSGRTFPGWKMVAGRSNRTIKDPIALAEAMSELYDDSTIYKPREINTITALEKAIGKKTFAEDYGDYIYKPEGKPTLVPESDKRPALFSPESDFEFEEAPQ